MWYAYVLESDKNHQFYIGHTDDLRQRVDEHNRKSGGKYTSTHGPYKLIFYEAYIEKKDAVAAELFFKTGYGREVLKGKLKFYLECQANR